MQNHRKSRFRSHDLRELEELVWRDLNAAVRAANTRAVTDGAMQRSTVSSKGLDREAQHLEQPEDVAVPAPSTSEEGRSVSADNAPDTPMVLDEADGLALDALDADRAGESVAAESADDQFIDGVAAWLYHQPHPDQMIAEIWCRLLALRTPSPGLERPVSLPQLQ